MIRFPPKKILVPFDLSALSETAWRHAVSLARRFDARLEVVFVEQWALTADPAPMPPPELSPEARGELLARIRKAVGESAKISIVTGDPALSILRLARRADLVVMGTHGRTGLRRAVLGSVTEAVARQSPTPVLAVRGGYSAIRAVLAPVNFTDYSYYGFTYAAALASALNAGLTALHVHLDPIWSGDPERKLAELIERLPKPLRKACRPVAETGQSDPIRGILHAGGKRDLIVLVAHEKSPLKDLILGTTAERVLRRSTSSVLIVPAPRKPLPLRADLPEACCAAP